MTQPMKDLSLSARVQQFSALVQGAVITDINGAVLDQEAGLTAVCEVLSEARDNRSTVFVIGNGGSAAIASHAVIDFVNVAKLRAFTLHEPSVLTCIANDYGYEYSYSRLLEQMAKPGDVLIAISSSGRSPNIRNAAAQVATLGGKVITLSGFLHDNPLRTQGLLNIWLDATDYGLVEVGHQFVLHNVADRFGAGYGRSGSSKA
ncbi:MAG: SIS domain-containing protein [Rhodocyclaceae bacterium]|nr:SIS domain-containing protein [Rhodocyclaceae bacterium]